MDTNMSAIDIAGNRTLKSGDVVKEGPNKGWIYCEATDGAGFFVAPEDERMYPGYSLTEYTNIPSPKELAAIAKTAQECEGPLRKNFNVKGLYVSNFFDAMGYHVCLGGQIISQRTRETRLVRRVRRVGGDPYSRDGYQYRPPPCCRPPWQP